MTTTIQIDCHAITGKGKVCGNPAKARITGNLPVCGIHARSEEQRGGEIRPLHGVKPAL